MWEKENKVKKWKEIIGKEKKWKIDLKSNKL